MTKSSTKGGRPVRPGPTLTGPDSPSLRQYRSKRDPRATNEPFAPEHKPSSGSSAASGTWNGDFVVHLHQASHRHFDLRLQIQGRLLSFAIPRGPTLDPAEKRLAIQTEDHPFEYLDFEDVIPQGNYGAGSMIVWDIGRVAYLEHNAEQGLQAGKLDFILHGHKLRGRFALVETGKRQKPAPKQRQWLLLKKTDAHARPGSEITEQEPHSVLSGMTVEQLARREQIERELVDAAADAGAPVGDVHAVRLEPMLCSTREQSLQQPGWVYELKLDGVRIIADKNPGGVTLRYRGARPTQSYPEIARAVRALAPGRVVLDGEIVAFDDAGKPSFQRLGSRIAAQRPADVKRACRDVPVTYLVFDLLQLGDRDLSSLPLRERKRLLAELVQGKGLLRRLDHIDDGQALFQLCEQQGLEGVVAKRLESPYHPGPTRGDDWVKIKTQREDDFVIVGWTEGKGHRKPLGSLEIASHDGERFVYRGRVGSGLDDALIEQLLPTLRSIEQGECPAVGAPADDTSPRHFCEPRLVVSVGYLQWTDEGVLRHPVLRGIRPDMEPRATRAAPSEERLEQALHASSTQGSETASGSPARGDWKSRAGRARLSNLDKIFWPEERYTKGDLLAYYANIAEVMLPHLAERPVMLVRYPDGIAGKSFYQWNVPEGTPAWVRTLQLRDEEHDGKEVATFLIDSVETLLHVINLGCIPLHMLAARQEQLEQCDFLTLDLDPGPQPFSSVVHCALALREILDEIGLRGFAKTSGQAGIHVFVPLGPGVSFAIARTLTDLLGRLLQARTHEISTLERRVSERGGRLLIDTGQTGPSRTIVAPYSARAHAGATVSTPLHWEEVHLALDPRELHIWSVPERVRGLGDPMSELLQQRPDVAAAAARLQTLFGL